MRGVAARSKPKSAKDCILTTRCQVMDQSVKLITEDKSAVKNRLGPIKLLKLVISYMLFNITTKSNLLCSELIII